MNDNTIKFTVPGDDRENMHRILRSVFDALSEKGYNPINQIVGYGKRYFAWKTASDSRGY